MATEFSTGKSIFILAIVAGCFAILWPNIFYPMLQGSYPAKSTTQTSTQGGCCDVIFDNDIEAIKVITDLCERILRNNQELNSNTRFNKIQDMKLTTAVIEACREAVWQKCHIDITQILSTKSGLTRSYKQYVEELRSLNSSVCLKQSFGVSFGIIGLPRTVRTWGLNRPKHLRQERPPHLRPEFLHPALREKGRAIPHSHIVPKIDGKQPGPIAGMRPPMGGAGHVVPPPKGSNTMGIVMPMYTIGIVVFFLYTMMKLMFKKSETNGGYDSFTPDADFHSAVFSERNFTSNDDLTSEDPTKLVLTAITGLVEEVNKQIRSDENQSAIHQEAKDEQSQEEKDETVQEIESIVDKQQDDIENEFATSKEEEKKSVKVIGYEMTESSSTGGKYSRPATPISRPSTPQPLYLSNFVPPQSQLLVSQEQTETLPPEDDEEPVVLSAKVTLSLIGLSERDNRDAVNNIANDINSNKSNAIMKNKELKNMSDDVDSKSEYDSCDESKGDEIPKTELYGKENGENEKSNNSGPTQLNQEFVNINSSEL